MPRKTQANNKTQPTDSAVTEYLAGIENSGRREDAHVLLDMMQEASGESAVMWGPSIVGFGQYHYVYESGREGDSFLVGFAPRKANMVVYIMPGFEAYQDLLDRLGRYRSGSSCLYLGRLHGVDLKVLRELIEKSVRAMRKKYRV